MGASVWRSEPEAPPESVGVDAGALDGVVEEFTRAVEAGELFHGAQLAVYRRGRLVLEAGGGLADADAGAPVTPETLFVTFSATKGLAGLAMAMLYERGAFHYDEAVTAWWPEFASVVEQKRGVTIRHVLSHRAGFPLGPRWLDADHWGDREAIRRAMIEIPLRFPPGSKNAYHAMNFGHVVNELVERIDGRDCGAFVREEVFAPLCLDDAFLGLPADAALEARVARCIDSSVANRLVRANDFNRPETWRAVLPAAGGIATARALGAVYAVLAQGGAGRGAELLRPGSLVQATTPTNRPDEIDGTIGYPIRWGLGFHVGAYGRGSTLRTFGHGGAGGQVAFADPERELAFAFLTGGERTSDFLLWRHRLQGRVIQACND